MNLRIVVISDTHEQHDQILLPEGDVLICAGDISFNGRADTISAFNRWFAAVLEVRDYVFNDKLENLQVGKTTAQQQDKSTWYGNTSLTNNVQAQFGAAIFLPFSFDYRLPK